MSQLVQTVILASRTFQFWAKVNVNDWAKSERFNFSQEAAASNQGVTSSQSQLSVVVPLFCQIPIDLAQ